ncbi:MAG: hypothetical protein PVJ66_08230 [Gammaproteobacteria bacterium]
MDKWLCGILCLVLVIPGTVAALGSAEEGEFERQLLLLDRISYHPSLLPLIMQNVDYLELTQLQQKRLRDWRENNAPAMLDKMKEVAQGRIEFIDLVLNPDSSAEELMFLQERLFRLQEKVLSYKLACRKNILETFTPEQWDALQFIMAER